MVRFFRSLIAISAGIFAPLAASASDLPSRNAPPPPIPAPAPAPGFGFISELRLGGSAQDPNSPESGSFNLTGEILFVKPFQLENRIADLFVPRAHIGGSVNFEGNTSFAYAGFSWTFDITQKFFVEATFGGAVHNGDTDSFSRPDHNALGCSPLFRESASVGFRITENWSVMGTVEHLSNAGLCDQNRGLTNFGAKIGYRF